MEQEPLDPKKEINFAVPIAAILMAAILFAVMISDDPTVRALEGFKRP